MVTQRKATTKGVTTRSMRKMKPANDITKIKKTSPKPSLIPTPVLRDSLQTTPPLNSSRFPIMLEKSFEDIISEFNEKFQKIHERFDQLQSNFNNYTNTEKPTNLSENLTNKEIELNEKILALRSENAQLFEKIRLLEKKSPPNNDFNEQQHIYYHVPVPSSFSALTNKDNHEGTSVLTEHSSSEGLQLGKWTNMTKKNPKKKKIPQPKSTLSPTTSTQEVLIRSVLIHIGTNDINNHKLYAVLPEKLASGIIEFGRTCNSFNVKEVFVTSVLCQKEAILSNQITCTNELLNKLCKENGFIYILNSNITPSHLFKDGIHLNDIGTFKLGDNFVKHVNPLMPGGNINVTHT